MQARALLALHAKTLPHAAERRGWAEGVDKVRMMLQALFTYDPTCRGWTLVVPPCLSSTWLISHDQHHPCHPYLPITTC